MIQQVTPDIWRVEFPLSFMGLHLGARMTIVRHQKQLLLISPVQIPLPLRQELSAMGEVSHIIAPNNMHHLFVEKTQQFYPNARTYISPGLKKKCPQLKYDGLLPSEDIPLKQIFIEGCNTFDETVFYDERSKTIICTDTIQHFKSCDHFFTRNYLKLAGIYKKVGLSALLRPTFKDRKQARKSIDQIAALDCERTIPAHGEIIEGPNPFNKAYAWLP